ncbi:MAG TPA: [protein-PII] uridylyltransferase [Acidimicrobiia bacterium]|nr:[protein-PII] uridylyltransferase [Acidimicrobiia bacterium]
MHASTLRDARDALVASHELRGTGFGRALGALLDDALGGLLDELQPSVSVPVALVALGSYARGELCPGSDIDVLLLHGASRKPRVRDEVRAAAERLWYPLWDAAFVTGHAARTVKQSIALADEDTDGMTALVHVRHVAGDPTLTAELEQRARQLAQRRARRLVEVLAAAADERRERPGPVAEMLEPDLKEGAGGLRDVHSLEWAGAALGAAGISGLAERGYLTSDDVRRLDAARERLLDLRVALHRVTGGRSDRLLLQEQDAVARAVGAADADAMVRDLATSAREVAWIGRDAWSRLRAAVLGPPGRVAHRDHEVAEGVVVREGRVVLTGTVAPSALTVLEAAIAAAEGGLSFERSSLLRLRAMHPPTWDVWERAAFLRLLRAGRGSIAAFEALDHEGALTVLLPEWEHVRSRPQRNAYHRFTVDRHLLEAVAECTSLLDAAEEPERTFDGVVARACRRPELLLLGALLHDIGKGADGDHSAVGADVAQRVARRIDLDSEGREILTWLVRHHLLMADTATRRDLSDAAVVDGFAAACSGDGERLRLLYLLTIGDSRATGAAAWGTSKAALVRELFVKTAAAIERGAAAAMASERRHALTERVGADRAERFLDALPDSYVLAFDTDAMVGHVDMIERSEPAIVCTSLPGGVVEITLVAPDRIGLLATASGALAVSGLSVREALLFGTSDGMALDVFRAADPFGRVDDRGTGFVASTLHAALADELDVEARVADRVRDYQRASAARGAVEITIDLDASDGATVIEVHADDEVGLLYRIATTFAELGLDVSVAKVATLGERVIDTFYVRDRDRKKITDDRVLGQIRATLVARLADSAVA